MDKNKGRWKWMAMTTFYHDCLLARAKEEKAVKRLFPGLRGKNYNLQYFRTATWSVKQIYTSYTMTITYLIKFLTGGNYNRGTTYWDILQLPSFQQWSEKSDKTIFVQSQFHFDFWPSFSSLTASMKLSVVSDSQATICNFAKVFPSLLLVLKGRTFEVSRGRVVLIPFQRPW